MISAHRMPPGRRRERSSSIQAEKARARNNSPGSSKRGESTDVVDHLSVLGLIRGTEGKRGPKAWREGTILS